MKSYLHSIKSDIILFSFYFTRKQKPEIFTRKIYRPFFSCICSNIKRKSNAARDNKRKLNKDSVLIPFTLCVVFLLSDHRHRHIYINPSLSCVVPEMEKTAERKKDLLEQKSLTTAIFRTLDLHKSWRMCFTIVLNYVTFMPLWTPSSSPRHLVKTKGKGYDKTIKNRLYLRLNRVSEET